MVYTKYTTTTTTAPFPAPIIVSSAKVYEQDRFHLGPHAIKPCTLYSDTHYYNPNYDRNYEGWVKVVTCTSDLKYLQHVPCKFEYGGRSLRIQWKWPNLNCFDNVPIPGPVPYPEEDTVYDATTDDILYTSGGECAGVGEIWIRCVEPGNTTINPTGDPKWCWKIGFHPDVYYFIEGYLSDLCETGKHDSLQAGQNAFSYVWSDYYYTDKQFIFDKSVSDLDIYKKNVPADNNYVNNCIWANIVLPSSNMAYNSQFLNPFGSRKNDFIPIYYKDGEGGLSAYDWAYVNRSTDKMWFPDWGEWVLPYPGSAWDDSRFGDSKFIGAVNFAEFPSGINRNCFFCPNDNIPGKSVDCQLYINNYLLNKLSSQLPQDLKDKKIFRGFCVCFNPNMCSLFQGGRVSTESRMWPDSYTDELCYIDPNC